MLSSNYLAPEPYWHNVTSGGGTRWLSQAYQSQCNITSISFHISPIALLVICWWTNGKRFIIHLWLTALKSNRMTPIIQPYRTTTVLSCQRCPIYTWSVIQISKYRSEPDVYIGIATIVSIYVLFHHCWPANNDFTLSGIYLSYLPTRKLNSFVCWSNNLIMDC